MAIAFDSSGVASVTSGSGTSLTRSHTCTGTNLILVVGVQLFDPAGIAVVDYNGIGMDQAGVWRNDSLTSWRTGIFYLIAPSTGTHNITVTPNTSMGIEIAGASYTGAAQTGQPDASFNTVQTSTTTFGSPTTRFTTIVDNCWMVGYFACGSLMASGTATTFRNTAGNKDFADSNVALTPAGLYALEATTSPADEFTLSAMSIKPFVASSNPSQFFFASLF
jgi:hypothetical protein